MLCRSGNSVVRFLFMYFDVSLKKGYDFDVYCYFNTATSMSQIMYEFGFFNTFCIYVYEFG